MVVATYNDAATIRRCVDSILDQTREPREIVVVDDGSTDATPEILADHPERNRIRVLRVPNGGPSRARNLGVRSASAELVAFFDGDCVLERRCLEELVVALDAEDVAGVGGRQRSPEDETYFGREVQRYLEALGFVGGYSQSSRAGSAVYDTEHNPSCNVLYRRRIYERLGGMDEGLWPGEDVDLDYRIRRAGYRLRFNADAVVAHYRPSSLAAFREMMTAYGRAQRLLVRRHGRFRPLHWLPTGAVMTLGVGALAYRFPRFATASIIGGGLASLLALDWRRRRFGASPIFYRLFFWNVSCWLSGYVSELAKPRFALEPLLADREPRSRLNAARPGKD